MSFERLPETVQTLYAELLDQAIRARAEMRDLPETGAFSALGSVDDDLAQRFRQAVGMK